MSTLAAPQGYENELYYKFESDTKTRDLLLESAPLMDKWAPTECKPKPQGGMEEWAKKHGHDAPQLACDWYHSTWQYLRLLDMVAVPPWYPFYNRALSSVLMKKPDSHVLISACADYGMLATLHQAIQTAGTKPRITIYDICNTPLQACQWYAKRHGLQIECVRDNIILSKSIPLGEFDLIVTDEFLTVLKDEDKPQITRRWLELLRPGGTLVTTAMLGGPTTPELRKGFAARAKRLIAPREASLRKAGVDPQRMMERIERFAEIHTRHMLTDEAQIRRLFSGYYLSFLSPTMTSGECVNPTHSFQIIASRPHVKSA